MKLLKDAYIGHDYKIKSLILIEKFKVLNSTISSSITSAKQRMFNNRLMNGR